MRWIEIIEAYTKQSVSPEDLAATPYDDGTSQERKDYLDKSHAEDPWRGPHENRELNLMLAGKKPAAWVIPDDYAKFKPYVDKGQFFAIERPGGWGYIVATTPERMKKIYDLFVWMDKHINDPDFNSDRLDAKLGILFGYTKEQIHKFLNNA